MRQEKLCLRCMWKDVSTDRGITDWGKIKTDD